MRSSEFVENQRAFNGRKDERKFTSSSSHLSPWWIYHHLPEKASPTDIPISSHSQSTDWFERSVLSSRWHFLSPETQSIGPRSRILLGLFWSWGLSCLLCRPCFHHSRTLVPRPWRLSSGQALSFFSRFGSRSQCFNIRQIWVWNPDLPLTWWLTFAEWNWKISTLHWCGN